MTTHEPIQATAIHLFYDPPGTLRLTLADERSYPGVKLYQAWPLSQPGKYLSLLNSKGEEIAMVPEVGELPAESRAVAEEELRRRYLTARVETVLNIRTEFGVTYWQVLTDKGERDFVVQSLSESCVWLSDHHILLNDVDGNRFEIVDRSTLDAASRAWVESVI